jgi:hypothetical protein
MAATTGYLEPSVLPEYSHGVAHLHPKMMVLSTALNHSTKLLC